MYYILHGHAGMATLKDVRLENVNCGADNKSAPWFAQAGDCDVRLPCSPSVGRTRRGSRDPPLNASVSSSPGGAMDWQPCADDPAAGCWYRTRSRCPEGGARRPPVARASTSRGGRIPRRRPEAGWNFTRALPTPMSRTSTPDPSEIVRVNAFGNPADSVGFGPNDFSVRVGLNRPLKQTPQARSDRSSFASRAAACRGRQLRCRQHRLRRGSSLQGRLGAWTPCRRTGLRSRPDASRPTTRRGRAGVQPEYDDLNELPPSTTTPDPVPTCAEGRPGQVSSMRQGLEYRFESFTAEEFPESSPCASTTGHRKRTTPTLVWTTPRYVILIVTDFGTFDENNERLVKVRRFAGSYVTGWDAGLCRARGQTDG